ncbi:MAG: fasciclin domain-containing protein [Acidimicrobiia bacterium]|nr:fasciclin domain-containing protein [Acidimicrobiia bacterium]
MRISSVPRGVVALGIVAALGLTAAACSSDDSSEAESTTPTTEAPMEAGTIVEVAAGTEDFSTLVAAVEAAGLVETLSGPGPFTVFAPTNAAFEALPAGTVDSLLEPANKDQLTSILTYHVVSGKVLAADLKDGQKVKTVQGEELTVGVSDKGVTVTDASGKTYKVLVADVEASNGVIHGIDGVLIPTK